MTLSCAACARAKQKCGKQTPCCLRCWSRGIDCQYPPSKPSNFVLCAEETTPFPVFAPTPPHSSRSTTESPERSELETPEITFDTAPVPPCISSPHSASWWFSSPDTWEIDHFPEGTSWRPPSASGLKQTVAQAHDWLLQWVDGNANPFIHPHLYRHRFPQCIQDAFMALTCYLHRKPSNEQAVFHIIQERATQLVEQAPSAKLDPLAQLARAQALLVYQLIGLYDGDIRLRCVAERHIPVLNGWMLEAVQSASLRDPLGAFLVSPTGTGAQLPWDKLAWYSWILAESLRRTWLVTAAVHGVYASTRDGVPNCLGGMKFTSRAGFWEAPSAVVWHRRCEEVYGGLVSLTQAEELFMMLKPGDLDDFAKFILEVTFGVEQMERWGVRSPEVC